MLQVNFLHFTSLLPELTDSQIASLRYKDQWGHYLKCMWESKVLRISAKEDWIPVLTVRDRGKHTYDAILPDVMIRRDLKYNRDNINEEFFIGMAGIKNFNV